MDSTVTIAVSTVYDGLFDNRKDTKMAIGSAAAANIAGGALGGAAGNLLNQLTDRLLHGAGRFMQSEPVQDAMNKIVKQQVPKMFGIGHTEESEFLTAVNLLDQDDQQRIARVVAALREKNKKHVQRWWMILAVKQVEGIMWDPQGPMIIPSQKKTQDADVWGIPKAASSGKGKGAYPVYATPADPRVIALQAVANMVREPHGPNNDQTLYDREGNELPPITGDSQEAVEFAAEHLRITVLEDYHFYSFLLKWWEDSPHLRNLFDRTTDAVKNQAISVFTFWIASEIGEETLRETLNKNSSAIWKRKAIELRLAKAVKAKWEQLGKRKLTESPLGLFVAFAIVFAVGGVALNTDSPLEFIGFLVPLTILALLVWGWRRLSVTTRRKGHN